LARRIRELAAADSLAGEIVHLRHEKQLAEDVTKECQRQLRSLTRLYDQALAARTPAQPEKPEET
jgi:hypothetical protein